MRRIPHNYGRAASRRRRVVSGELLRAHHNAAHLYSTLSEILLLRTSLRNQTSLSMFLIYVKVLDLPLNRKNRYGYPNSSFLGGGVGLPISDTLFQPFQTQCREYLLLPSPVKSENSTDLGSGRRPTFKSVEFSDFTGLGKEILRCEFNADFGCE